MSKQAISRTYIKAVAKDCGVERMNQASVEFIQEQVHDYIKYLIGEGKVFMEHNKRMTLSKNDLISSVKRTL